MLYVLGIILPPAAVTLSGRTSAVRLNLLLTCLFWVPGVVHALIIVNEVLAEERKQSLTRALEEIAALTPRSEVTQGFERNDGEAPWEKLLGTR